MLKDFTDKFNHKNFEVEMVTFKKFSPIVKNIQSLGKTHAKGKKEIMEFFSDKSWLDLPEEQKDLHKIFNCNGCISSLLFKSKLSLFETRNRVFKNKSVHKELCTAKDLVNTTTKIIDDLNNDYRYKYKTTFTEVAQATCHGIFGQLNPEPDRKLKKHVVKERMDLINLALAKVQENWGKSEVERYTYSAYILYIVYGITIIPSDQIGLFSHHTKHRHLYVYTKY